MDTTTEAPLQPFPIGPSSIFGRFVVLRVLLCHSLSSLRHRMLHLLSHLFPFLPHPKKPAGILLFILFLFFSLRRSSATRRAARSAYRRRFWRNLMRSALTFDEWQHAARMLEKENMDDKGNSSNLSSLYDEDLIRSKILELRLQRVSGDIRDVVFSLRADLVRNLGNMCNPRLHKGRVTVPPLIRDYIDEVSAQLRLICDDESEDFPVDEKLAFMQETRHAFGRTALLLSGGASLGAFHVGVVKALVENKLLPRIIAGSSVGSVMCAIVGTRTWPELQSFFEDSWHSLKFFDQLGGIFTVVKRILNQGAVHEIRQLQKMLRVLTSNLTFQEAYDLTGRIVGITVCSPRPHEPPRCLNYLTSPNVVIWSAVTASCAFPGLFEAQELMAKDRRGELVPYHTSVWITEAESMKIPAAYEVKNRERRWRDGSLESDLPMVQLKELFNVNHFIVSQANPHIAPFLRIKEIVRAYGGDFAAKLAHLLEMEVKHRCNQILYMGFPLGGIAKLFAQDWEGDVTIVMPATLAQYSKIIQNLSHVELQKSANQGRRCTWEKLSAIKANCGIEIVLDECVAYLNHVRRVKRRAAAASKGLVSGPSTVRLNSSRRIPSWNCIARENSSGSLDEESLGEGSQHHQGRNMKINGHEHSDGETDSVDVNVSWTMSGGPLMRTASANLFINFVQSLEFQPELEKVAREAEASSSHGNSDDIETAQFNNQCDSASPNSGNKAAGSCSSITVSEGDLLKPERVENRIVLNVVKKEDLLLGNVGSESQPQQFPESVQLDGYNASSASDCGDDDEEGSADGSNPEQVTNSENKNNH